LWEKVIPPFTLEIADDRIERHNHDHDHDHDLHEPPSDNTVTVLRLKGIITPPTEDGDERRRRLVVQGVHDLYDIHEAVGDTRERSTSDDLSKIVLIGRNLQRARLEASFCEWVGVAREELVK